MLTGQKSRPRRWSPKAKRPQGELILKSPQTIKWPPENSANKYSLKTYWFGFVVPEWKKMANINVPITTPPKITVVPKDVFPDNGIWFWFFVAKKTLNTMALMIAGAKYHHSDMRWNNDISLASVVITASWLRSSILTLSVPFTRSCSATLSGNSIFIFFFSQRLLSEPILR